MDGGNGIDNTRPGQVSLGEISAILSSCFGQQDWKISKPKDGWHKESFIAKCQDRHVFVKFDVDPQPLKRLGELGVAPPWLGSGTHSGRQFSIQQYIDGEYPRRQWFQQHLGSVGRLFARYHRDQPLSALIPKQSLENHRDLLDREVQTLWERMEKGRIGLFSSRDVHRAFDEFRSQAEHLRGAPSVPIHCDPNRKNFLLLDEHLFMVDWDELSLSDPMRDVGPFLWWHAPPHTWGDFFESYEERLDQPHLDRMYWWAARQSLQIALWIAQHSANRRETDAFMNDFKACVAQEVNPRLGER